MAHDLIAGSFVAIVTPFNRDGSVDFEGFRTILDFQERNGSVAVLIMGSTGEVSMLSIEERHEIIRQTVKMKKGKMQLWYCLLYTSPSPRDRQKSRMPSSA